MILPIHFWFGSFDLKFENIEWGNFVWTQTMFYVLEFFYNSMSAVFPATKIRSLVCVAKDITELISPVGVIW